MEDLITYKYLPIYIDFHHVRHYSKNSPLNDMRGGNFDLLTALGDSDILLKHNNIKNI